MKKSLTGILILSLLTLYVPAQTKVFKEVSEEISSQIKTIRQDNALVGYVVFTQLEKASEDSFNYKITVMDENLNDIGTVNFRDIKLFLQAVSFEQDVLCLAYVKTNIIGNEYKNGREFRSAVPKGKNSVFIQFLGLDGKIIKSQTLPAEINVSDLYGTYSYKHLAGGKLKHPIQLQNIANRGFACFYGDETRNNLVIYNATGEKYWQKQVKEAEVQAFGLLTSGNEAYLLMKKNDRMIEGGFELLSYGINDSASHPKYVLKDKHSNSLKVLTFENDPQTGKPYLTGLVINPDRGNKFSLARDLAKGTYNGVFTINVNGNKKSDIKEVYSYWSDDSQSLMNRRGYYKEQEVYARYARSFKDAQGNTYFTGSAFVKKPKWGSIVSSVVFAPLIVPSVWILTFSGTSKARVQDAVLLKQNAKGSLSLESSIPANNSKFYMGKIPMSYYDNRSFYNVFNANTKTDYLIVDDIKDIIIYNVNQKKVVRTIPHKEGNVSTFVYPAKEGHVMVSEYNRKEKYTRFSIEAL